MNTTTRHTALVERCGNLIRITPSYKTLLAQHCHYSRRVQQGGRRGSTVVQPVHLFREEGNSLIVPAGLTRRVIGILQQAGITVSFSDLRTARIGEPDFESLEPLRELQPEVIAAIAAHDMLQVEGPTGIGKSFIIRQIPILWPTANIVITSPFGDIVRDTYASLLERFPSSVVGMIGDGKSETGRRITCALTQSLHLCTLERCDIFVFDEVHRAAAPATAEQLARVQNARMIGFSANTSGRSDKADLETEAIFGPPMVKITYQQGQATGSIVPMEVLIMPTNHVEQLNCPSSSLERWGLWRNEDRNKLIKEGIDLVCAEHGEDIQILITVATVEHAVHLAKLLPDYALVYAQMDGDKRIRWEKAGLIPTGIHPITAQQKDQYKKDFKEGKLRRVIATGKWGTGVDFPLLNLIVRADGQGGDIASTQLPGRATRKSEGKNIGLVLDLNDTFHQTLEGRFKRRCTVYRKKGWKIKFLKPIPRYLQQ